MVDEDPPHRLRGDGKEVRAIVEGDRLGAEQAYTQFVDKRVRLERVIAAFVVEEACGDLLQLRLHDGKQLVARAIITLSPVAQPARDLLRQRRSFHGAAAY